MRTRSHASVQIPTPLTREHGPLGLPANWGEAAPPPAPADAAALGVAGVGVPFTEGVVARSTVAGSGLSQALPSTAG
jgi:hypothetical protein